MLKNILKLEGAQQLSKNEQKEISGGTVAMTIICRCLETGIKVGVVSSYAECTILRMQYCNA